MVGEGFIGAGWMLGRGGKVNMVDVVMDGWSC
jgi:hypothetical protein